MYTCIKTNFWDPRSLTGYDPEGLCRHAPYHVGDTLAYHPSKCSLLKWRQTVHHDAPHSRAQVAEVDTHAGRKRKTFITIFSHQDCHVGFELGEGHQITFGWRPAKNICTQTSGLIHVLRSLISGYILLNMVIKAQVVSHGPPQIITIHFEALSQTLWKLFGVYQTKEGFWPDCADFTHDYQQMSEDQ